MMRGDLQYDLCPGCGEIAPKGILSVATHICPLNTITYRGYSHFGLRHFKDLFSVLSGGRGCMQSFYDLLVFPYLKAMPNYETASYMDRFIYSVCRDAEIREMKRLRVYIELEEDFNSKWW